MLGVKVRRRTRRRRLKPGQGGLVGVHQFPFDAHHRGQGSAQTGTRAACLTAAGP